MSKSQELLEIIVELETYKEKQAEAKGALKEIQKELKEKFGCTSLEEVRCRVDELKERIQEQTQTLDEGIEKLSEDMEEAGL